MPAGSVNLLELSILGAYAKWTRFEKDVPSYENCPAAATNAVTGTCGRITEGGRAGTWVKGPDGLKVDWTAKAKRGPEASEVFTVWGGFEDRKSVEGTRVRRYYGGGEAGAQWEKCFDPEDSELPSGPPIRQRFLASKAEFEPTTSAHATGISEISAIGKSYIVVLIDRKEIAQEFHQFHVPPGRYINGGFGEGYSD